MFFLLYRFAKLTGIAESLHEISATDENYERQRQEYDCPDDESAHGKSPFESNVRLMRVFFSDSGDMSMPGREDLKTLIEPEKVNQTRPSASLARLPRGRLRS